MVFITLFLVALLYVQTALRYLWTADAADFIIAATRFDLAHPPGYPLYILLLKLFYLLPFSSLTFKTSLLSVGASLVSLFVLYKTAELILKQVQKKRSVWDTCIVNVCVAIFALTPLWWLYSISQEVFMLTACFISAISYMSVRFLYQKPTRKECVLYILVISFALFHQYVVALLLLPVALVLVTRRKCFDRQALLLSSVALFVGFIPYMFFLSQAGGNSWWFDTNSIADLLYIALRKNYGTFWVFGLSAFTPSFGDRLATLAYYAESLFQSFGVLLFFIVVGLVCALRERKTRLAGAFFLLQFLLFGPLLAFFYSISPDITFNKVIFERFILLSFPSLFVFLFYGSYCLFLFFHRFSKALRAPLVYLVLLAIIPVLLFIKNYEYFKTIAHDKTIQLLGERALAFLPKNSLFVVNSDIIYFPVEYASQVLKIRPDVTVLSQQVIIDSRRRASREKWFVENRVKMPQKIDKDFFESFVKLNAKTRPVMSSFSIHDSKLFTQVGPVYEHVSKEPIISYDKAKLFFKGLSMQDYSQGNRIKPYGIMEAERFFSKAANFYAQHWFLRQDYLKSIQFAHTSLDMYLSQETMYFLGGLYYKIGDCDQAREVWKKSYFQFVDLRAVTQLKNLELVCFKDKERAAFWLYIEKRMKNK